MQDIGKVNSIQIFNLWKNLTVGIVVLIAVIAFSKVLPYYLSPIVSLLLAAFLYFYINNSRNSSGTTCIMPIKSILISVLGFSFIIIILNLISIWGTGVVPNEFIFFHDQFIPSLILNPVGFVVSAYIYYRHNSLKTCINCRMQMSMGGKRGASGVLNHEAHYQLKCLMVMSGTLTLAVWVYYFFLYVNVNINSRDAYVFTWLTIIGLLLAELYFIFRYYNLYLDLKENNEIITQAELHNMSAKTYIRYYVVCDNYMFMTAKDSLPGDIKGEVLDTPFFTLQSFNGLGGDGAKLLIEKMTGVDNGTLRFFYGSKSPNDDKHRLLRYFYFLPGKPEDYSELNKEGEWINFDKIKYYYSNNQTHLGELAVSDITRLATIILTEKIFDEEGNRKSKIKLYNPTFNLKDVEKSTLDFQDDKWIEISMLNSDTPMFKLKKWWKKQLKKS